MYLKIPPCKIVTDCCFVIIPNAHTVKRFLETINSNRIIFPAIDMKIKPESNTKRRRDS